MTITNRKTCLWFRNWPLAAARNGEHNASQITALREFSDFSDSVCNQLLSSTFDFHEIRD